VEKQSPPFDAGNGPPDVGEKVEEETQVRLIAEGEIGEDGGWRMKDGEWRMEDGAWRMELGLVEGGAGSEAVADGGGGGGNLFGREALPQGTVVLA